MILRFLIVLELLIKTKKDQLLLHYQVIKDIEFKNFLFQRELVKKKTLKFMEHDFYLIYSKNILK